MATTANVNRGKNQRPYTPDQFMPVWDPEGPAQRRPEMSGHEMLEAVKGIQRQFTRRERRPGGDPS